TRHVRVLDLLEGLRVATEPVELPRAGDELGAHEVERARRAARRDRLEDRAHGSDAEATLDRPAPERPADRLLSRAHEAPSSSSTRRLSSTTVWACRIPGEIAWAATGRFMVSDAS